MILRWDPFYSVPGARTKSQRRAWNLAIHFSLFHFLFLFFFYLSYSLSITLCSYPPWEAIASESREKGGEHRRQENLARCTRPIINIPWHYPQQLKLTRSLTGHLFFSFFLFFFISRCVSFFAFYRSLFFFPASISFFLQFFIHLPFWVSIFLTQTYGYELPRVGF